MCINDIDFSWGKNFFSDFNPITRELLKNPQIQLVYYNFNRNDSLAITQGKDEASLIIYVLEGSMCLYAKEKETLLGPHDSVLFSDIQESAILSALAESKCLGISTHPYQHVASSNELMAMIDIVEKKDVYTSGHSRRVCMYANTLALSLNRNYDIITLGNAADLHDVGKINTPLEILRKPVCLTMEEYDVIKQHSVDSYKLLLSMGDEVAIAARQHHERMDGSGYPDGLQGEEICLNARIIAIADVFDALTCRRVYNDPISFEEAVAYLESCGKAYDQTILAILKEKVYDGTLARKGIHSSFSEDLIDE